MTKRKPAVNTDQAAPRAKRKSADGLRKINRQIAKLQKDFCDAGLQARQDADDAGLLLADYRLQLDAIGKFGREVVENYEKTGNLNIPGVIARLKAVAEAADALKGDAELYAERSAVEKEPEPEPAAEPAAPVTEAPEEGSTAVRELIVQAAADEAFASIRVPDPIDYAQAHHRGYHTRPGWVEEYQRIYSPGDTEIRPPPFLTVAREAPPPPIAPAVRTMPGVPRVLQQVIEFFRWFLTPPEVAPPAKTEIIDQVIEDLQNLPDHIERQAA